jgi:hypothetical protein
MDSTGSLGRSGVYAHAGHDGETDPPLRPVLCKVCKLCKLCCIGLTDGGTWRIARWTVEKSTLSVCLIWFVTKGQIQPDLLEAYHACTSRIN